MKRTIALAALAAALASPAAAAGRAPAPALRAGEARGVALYWLATEYGADNGAAKCRRHSPTVVACLASFYTAEGPLGDPGVWRFHVTIRRSGAGVALTSGWTVHRYTMTPGGHR